MDFSNIYITTFIQSIPAHQQRLEDAFQENDGAAELMAMISFCCESIKNIGDQSFLALTGKTVEQFNNQEHAEAVDVENTPAQELEAHFITFDWVVAAKSFTLLLRDILVKHQKTTLLLTEQDIDSEAVSAQKDKSQAVIEDAYTYLKYYFERSMKAFSVDSNTAEKKLEGYKVQDNPWPVFQQQFTQIDAQAGELKATGKRLSRIQEDFQKIKDSILATPQICKKEYELFVEKANYAKEFVDNNMREKSGKVVSFLEELENEIKLTPHLDVFTHSLQDDIENLGGKLMIPFAVRGGFVQQKEINFRKKVGQWIDAEILPLLYEFWEHTEALEGNLKMSLINIHNRAVILDNDPAAAQNEKENYSLPLELYLQKAKSWHEKMCALEEQIQERVATSFHLSPIYKPDKEFLPLSMQSTFNNLDIGQNEVILFFQNQYNRVKRFIRRVQKTVEKEETLSQSEKVVRAIESLSIREPESQYNTIFQTRGYVGESFWVGRQEPLQHMNGIIDMWEKGFRGGVMLIGQRLSGKTLFGEKVANLYFPKNTIRVTVNSMVKVNGKKMVTGYDLGEILDFIKNNTINNRALVWIDDLELWANESTSLGSNVRALKEFMDTYSGQLFCMVSMSNWVKSHLNHLYKIDASFQAEINLDRMDRQEVSKAIMIRHGATHKLLVGENNEELSTKAMQEKIARVFKSSAGVIGDALNRWVIGMYETEENKVRHQASPNYKLPDFLTPDISVLLTAIFLQKVTTDYRLRRLFGSPFKNKYKPILRRLISLKIVVRNLDGSLEIHESIANELARNLSRKKYLQF